MGVEKVEHLAGATVVSIHEPTRFGERDVFREVRIPHDRDHLAQFETISRERAQKPLDDPRGAGVEEMEFVEVPDVGTVVFVKDFDCDWSSASYRRGAHTVRGQYLLTE